MFVDRVRAAFALHGDHAQPAHEARGDGGLLEDLAHRRLFGRLPQLDVTAGKRPLSGARRMATSHEKDAAGMVDDDGACRQHRFALPLVTHPGDGSAACSAATSCAPSKTTGG
jgi:hypothetical protein